MFKFFLILLKVLKHFTNVLILNQKSNNSGLCKSVIVLKLLSILQFYLKNCSSILITSEFIKISLAKDDNKVTVEIETNSKSIERDPYCCAIEAMVGNSTQLKTVAHILRKSPDMHILS